MAKKLCFLRLRETAIPLKVHSSLYELNVKRDSHLVADEDAPGLECCVPGQADDPKTAASAETIAGFKERPSNSILRYLTAMNPTLAERSFTLLLLLPAAT